MTYEPDPPFSAPTRLPANWAPLEPLVRAGAPRGAGPYAQIPIRRLLQSDAFAAVLAELYRDGMFGVQREDAVCYLTPEQRDAILMQSGVPSGATREQRLPLLYFLSSPEMVEVLDATWRAGAEDRKLTNNGDLPADWLDYFNPYVAASP